MFQIRVAVAKALGAAAARAKLLADQEDRELELLMSSIVEAQVAYISYISQVFWIRFVELYIAAAIIYYGQPHSCCHYFFGAWHMLAIISRLPKNILWSFLRKARGKKLCFSYYLLRGCHFFCESWSWMFGLIPCDL